MVGMHRLWRITTWEKSSPCVTVVNVDTVDHRNVENKQTKEMLPHVWNSRISICSVSTKYVKRTLTISQKGKNTKKCIKSVNLHDLPKMILYFQFNTIIFLADLLKSSINVLYLLENYQKLTLKKYFHWNSDRCWSWSAGGAAQVYPTTWYIWFKNKIIVIILITIKQIKYLLYGI